MDRQLAKQLRVEIHSDLGPRARLGEPEDETVVLAAERDCRRAQVVRLEDLDRAPRVLGPGRDHPRNAGFLHSGSKVPGAKRKIVTRSANVLASPLAPDARSK